MGVETTCAATWKLSLFDLHVPDKAIASLLDNPDAVAAAGQFGRLDFFSGLLASTALLISFAAVFAFIHVNRKAKQAAKDAALAEVKGEAPRLIREYLETHPELWAGALRDNPGILASAMKMLDIKLGNGVRAEAADEIAESMAETEEGENGKNP